MDLVNHDLLPGYEFRHIRYETRPVKDRAGKDVDGLHQVWIYLDNEKQLNSYTTAAVKEVILAVNATVEGQTTAHYITDQLEGMDVALSMVSRLPKSATG